MHAKKLRLKAQRYLLLFIFSALGTLQCEQQTTAKAILKKPSAKLYATTLPNKLDSKTVTISKAPDTFGSTHFIIGCTNATVRKPKASGKISPNASSDNIQALFSPDHNVRERLISFIANEKKSIKIAAFSFTDPDITDALCTARKKGIMVTVITDPNSLQDRGGKIGILCESGIEVRVYNANYAKNTAPSYMHHKFVIFQENENDLPILWTGSLNLTKSACNKNQENVTIIRDAKTIADFKAQYEILLERSKSYR